VQHDGFKQLLALTDKEKQKLIDKKSASISEFKQQVQRLLEAKTHKTHIEHTVLTPQYDIVDPELLEAARLGKHALRDPRMVAFLWDKFKNQNKIATFLGVNRSSVNRRCKEYGIF
jgi:DNA-binding protein Fis